MTLIEMYKEIQNELSDYELDEVMQSDDEIIKNPCPECGEELINEGGCIQCKS
jgi:predicted RNA-binding Zn-ribbon protein involved in translation (DUF1610 family)